MEGAIGSKDHLVEWVAVRPDALSDEKEVTEYNVHISPLRNAIFDSGTTSRVNVGNFITELILNESVWLKWKGQMPVIYNRA